MKTKLTRQEIMTAFELFNHDVMLKLEGKKFAYAIARTSNYFEGEVKAIRKVADNPDYAEYTRKRIEIYQKYGNINGNSFTIRTDKQDEFNQKIEELQKEPKYAKSLKDIDIVNKEIGSLLSEEIEIDVHMVDYEDIPEGISPYVLKRIFFMINKPVPDVKDLSKKPEKGVEHGPLL